MDNVFQPFGFGQSIPSQPPWPSLTDRAGSHPLYPPHGFYQQHQHPSAHPSPVPTPGPSNPAQDIQPDPFLSAIDDPQPAIDPPPQHDDQPMDEEPLYVNAKQYYRILKRRLARARLEEVHRLSKQRKVGRLGRLPVPYAYPRPSLTCTNRAISMRCVVHADPAVDSSRLARSPPRKASRWSPPALATRSHLSRWTMTPTRTSRRRTSRRTWTRASDRTRPSLT
jgi:hypothetical protein